ncbi:hypothetical protein J7U46_16050 [Pelomonas sp. V22]|uniref:hypothetical protein n=1 Tax=Pelomonas sp. V22 TaxID=2822139 RepID=UPI0024A7B42E|nr:hypothetical protein [Pelomonas sp. V22]MDI4634572.1 hypothetical protein [Pelomonas sp. V22]
MRPIERVIALWRTQFLSDEEVVAWADRQILKSDCASQELIDLSLYGPAQCLRRSDSDFAAALTPLPYSTEFALRASALPMSSAESVLAFCKWCARSAMGEELAIPEVSFGYHVDHLLHDCYLEEEAIGYARSKLPELLSVCSAAVAPFLEVLLEVNFQVQHR